jgi:hypothetical protein
MGWVNMEKTKGFKDIVFGKAAAENEKSRRYRKLLLDGFLDDYGYTNLLLYDEKFLVLGLKGSGKSAIAARLELLAEQSDDFIVTNYDLSTEFPHKLFSKLLNLHENEAQLTKFQYYWEYLILLVFIESFSKDDSATYSNREQYKLLLKVMEQLELMPTMSFTNLVTKLKAEDFEANLNNALSTIKGSKKGLSTIFNLLREICYSISVKRKHLLIIDGLDSLMTQQIKQNNIIASLVVVSDAINRHFLENDINAKIILLCRTDLFDILPGANLNKIKQDSAIILNWYQEGVPANSTNLIKMINLRIRTSIGYDTDIFEFFPGSIQSGSLTVKTLLDHTRYRPRDLIALLNYIQTTTEGNLKPAHYEVLAGIMQYSREFLLSEIKNELYGFLNDDEREKSMKLLSLMNKSTFNFEEIENIKNADTRFQKLDTIRILQALFDCGAILNFRKDESGVYIYTSKIRNPTACFDPHQSIRIMRGLWKTFNFREDDDTY